MTSITYLYIFAIISLITGIFWTGSSCYRVFVNEGGAGISRAVWTRLLLGLAFIVPVSTLVFTGINVLATQKVFKEQLDTSLNAFAAQSEPHFEAAQTLRLCANDDLNRLLSGRSLYKAIECLKLNQLNLNFANLTSGEGQDARNTAQNQLILELRSSSGMGVVDKINTLDEKLDTFLVLFLSLLGLLLLISGKLLIDNLP